MTKFDWPGEAERLRQHRAAHRWDDACNVAFPMFERMLRDVVEEGMSRLAAGDQEKLRETLEFKVGARSLEQWTAGELVEVLFYEVLFDGRACFESRPRRLIRMDTLAA